MPNTSLRRENPISKIIARPIRAPTVRRPQQKQQTKRTCPNPSCTDPNIEEHDDKRVCTSCGFVISDSNIVSEVQFGETSSGAAVVQGSYVGADQSHARSMGTAFKRASGTESREQTDKLGKFAFYYIASMQWIVS
jgi:transcription factor IIIB subunit 2